MLIRKSVLLSGFAWLIWLCVAVAFMMDSASALVPAAAVVAELVSAVLIFREPLLGLYLLPLPLLLGPVVSLPISGVGNVTAGDLYAVLLVFRTLVLRWDRLNFSLPRYLWVPVLLLVCSTAFSADVGASLAGLSKILEFALLVAASVSMARRPRDWRNMFTAWVASTTLGSVMVLWFLYHGQPLFLLNWAGGLDEGRVVDIDSPGELFRPAFFYANFFIPMGLSLVYALLVILRKLERNPLRNILFGLSIPINAIALVLNNTRSMLFPVIAVAALALGWYTVRAVSKAGTKLLPAIVTLIVVGGGVYVVSDLLITEQQVVALLDRSADSSPVDARLSVWTSVLGKLGDTPARFFLVGWGPQATARQGGAGMQRLLTGSEGNAEGAFDSTIVGFLVEYGMIFTLLVFSYIAIWHLRVWSRWRQTGDTTTLIVLSMGIVLVLTHLLQQFGVSPPALMAMQIFSMSPRSDMAV